MDTNTMILSLLASENPMDWMKALVLMQELNAPMTDEELDEYHSTYEN